MENLGLCGISSVTGRSISKYGLVSGGFKGGTIPTDGSGKDSGVIGIETDASELE